MNKKESKWYPRLSDARSRGSVECLICGRILSGRYGYVTHHKRVHHDKKPRWQYTESGSDNPRDLPYQRDITKKGTKVCKLCGHMIGSIGGLHKHFNAEHAGITTEGNYKIVAIVHIDCGKIRIAGIV
jgi:hypothetical protein